MIKRKKTIGGIVFASVLGVATTALTVFITAWNDSAKLQMYLGDRYLDALDYEQALAAYQKALNIDPKNAEIYARIAEVYDDMDETTKAVEALRSGYVKTEKKELVNIGKEDYAIDVRETIQTVEDEVVVVQTGLDICFVIDTTGSMGSYIYEVKQNMQNIVAEVAAKSENYRIAIVDYRDFAYRTGDWYDYPAKLQLDFTSDLEAIQAGIDGLELGNGGDTDETVYSGLMLAASLKWKPTSQHVVILLGDAPALSPEPVTGLTQEDVIAAMEAGKATVDYSRYIYDSYEAYSTDYDKYLEEGGGYSSLKKEWRRSEYASIDYALKASLFASTDDTLILAALDDEDVSSGEEKKPSDSKKPANISLYGITTSGYSDVESSFGALTDELGGYTTSSYSSSVTEEICTIVETVEVVPVTANVTADFGEEHAGTVVEIYSGSLLVCDVDVNSVGKAKINEILYGEYSWKNRENGASGTMTLLEDSSKAKIEVLVQPNANRIVMLEILIGSGISLALIALVAVLNLVGKKKR